MESGNILNAGNCSVTVFRIIQNHHYQCRQSWNRYPRVFVWSWLDLCELPYISFLGHDMPWVGTVFGTSCLEYELFWVRFVLSTSCHGHEVTWVRVDLGTSCPGYELRDHTPCTISLILVQCADHMSPWVPYTKGQWYRDIFVRVWSLLPCSFCSHPSKDNPLSHDMLTVIRFCVGYVHLSIILSKKKQKTKQKNANVIRKWRKNTLAW